jgi:hypothetical protein
MAVDLCTFFLDALQKNRAVEVWGIPLEAGIRPSNIGMKRVESDIMLDIGLNFLPISEFLLFMCSCPCLYLFHVYVR